MRPSANLAIAVAFFLLSLGADALAQTEVLKPMPPAARLLGQQRMRAFRPPIAPNADAGSSFPQINPEDQGNTSYITFDVGTLGTFPAALNAEGTIVGFYNDAKLVTHGFLRTFDGTVKTFDGPGSTAIGSVGASI